ncbi:peptide deformylase [bacterium]|nr:peptide deformylase [bacterium]
MINIELKIYPNELLRKVSKDVKNIDQKLSKVYNEMCILMNNEKGIGLAAPQIGINERFFISKDFSDDSDKTIIFINPEIIEAEDIVESKEGCLSIPGHYDYVKRSNRILVSYLDLSGKNEKREFLDMQSIVFQHELDHLDGILFPDRLPKIRKDIFFKKIDKEFKK